MKLHAHAPKATDSGQVGPRWSFGRRSSWPGEYIGAWINLHCWCLYPPAVALLATVFLLYTYIAYYCSVEGLIHPLERLVPLKQTHGFNFHFRLHIIQSDRPIIGDNMHLQSLALSFATGISFAAAQTTIIPSTCFDSYSDLEEYFSYLYPWGSDHNGAARMSGNSSNHEYISINDAGTLTIAAKRVDGEPPAGDLEIKYLSGAVHARDYLTVEEGSGFDIEAEFKATTDLGTWPAFWLTAVDSWPPEIDLAEWKG